MTTLLNNIDVNLSFNGENIRIVGTNENPYFMVSDICKILGIGNTTEVMKNIPDKWRSQVQAKGGKSTGFQTFNTVNEAGLYKIIMRSKKKIAERFQEWVCGEVLPSLRKSGEYKMNDEYQMKLKQLEDENLEIKKELDIKDEKIEIQEKELREKSNRVKLLEKKTNKRPVSFENGKNVVYLITNEYLYRERTFVLGRAVNLPTRLSAYNKTSEHEVVYKRECHNAKQMALIEENLLYKLDKYRERANRDRFVLPDDSDISLFTNMFDQVCDLFNDVDKDVAIEKRDDDRFEIFYEDNKEYIKEYKRQHYQENRDENAKKTKVYYEDHKEAIDAYQKNYKEENCDIICEQRAMYRQENKEKIKEQNSEYYHENKDQINAKQKIYQEENKEKILKQRKEYYDNNIEVIRAKDRARNPKETCECGLQICRRSMTNHLKSKTHDAFMKRKMNESKPET
jgi:prophage antirepressor-like protein